MADDSTDRDDAAVRYVTRDGQSLAAIRYGDEPDDWGAGQDPCRDCGVDKGMYHVPGCGVERCPRCGDQYWSCECDFLGDAPDEEEFSTAAEYARALAAVRAEGVPDNHLALVRAHHAAPDHTATWAQLAAAVGYAGGNAVNLQYGRFAGRVARQFGLTDKPLDPGGAGWWLWVLVRWADDPDPESGHTAFALRRPVVEALEQLGIVPASAGG